MGTATKTTTLHQYSGIRWSKTQREEATDNADKAAYELTRLMERKLRSFSVTSIKTFIEDHWSKVSYFAHIIHEAHEAEKQVSQEYRRAHSLGGFRVGNGG